MKQGFVKVASATPRIRVADPVYNAQVICEQAKEAAEQWSKDRSVSGIMYYRIHL